MCERAEERKGGEGGAVREARTGARCCALAGPWAVVGSGGVGSGGATDGRRHRHRREGEKGIPGGGA